MPGWRTAGPLACLLSVSYGHAKLQWLIAASSRGLEGQMLPKKSNAWAAAGELPTPARRSSHLHQLGLFLRSRPALGGRYLQAQQEGDSMKGCL